MKNRKFFNSLNKNTWWGWTNWLLNWLVSYWKADTNWSFLDSHWSNDMILAWPTFLTTAKINWWYNFDWVNDNCYINKNETYSACSLSCWVKYTENLANWFINLWRYNWAGWNQIFRLIWRATVKASVWLAWSEISADYWVNKNDWIWHHIWCSWDSAWDWKIRLYIDWTLVATSSTAKTSSFVPWTWADYWHIWWYTVDNDTTDATWKYKWDIDECALWNVALTDEQFAELYNNNSWLSYNDFTN